MRSVQNQRSELTRDSELSPTNEYTSTDVYLHLKKLDDFVYPDVKLGRNAKRANIVPDSSCGYDRHQETIKIGR